MKKTFFAMVLTLALMLSLSQAVFAADAVITYKDHSFNAAAGTDYTATDLFDDLKGCMPGDSLTETIILRNESAEGDKIRVTLTAEVTDPTYSESYEAEDGNDQAGVTGERDETAATMADFLAKLNMRIYAGSNLVYEGSAAGGSSIYLGELRSGDELQLRVVLEVPATLGNEYANRVGEVKWVFHGEVFEYRSLTLTKIWKGDRASVRPRSITVDLLADGQLSQTVTLTAANNWVYTWPELDTRYFWTVREHAVNGYSASYVYADDNVAIFNTAGLIHTGQLVWPIPVLGGLGALLLLAGALLLRRDKQQNA